MAKSIGVHVGGPEDRVVSAKIGGINNVIFAGSGLYRDRHNASFSPSFSGKWYENVPRVRTDDDDAPLSLKLVQTPGANTAAGAAFDAAIKECPFPTIREWTVSGAIAKIPNDVYRCFCTYFFPKLGNLGVVRGDGGPIVTRLHTADWIWGALPAYAMAETPPSYSKTVYSTGGQIVYTDSETTYGGSSTPGYAAVDVTGLVSYTLTVAPCSFYYSVEEDAFYVEGGTVSTRVATVVPSSYSSDESWSEVSSNSKASESVTRAEHTFSTPEMQSHLTVLRKEVDIPTLAYDLPLAVHVLSFSVEDIVSGSADIPCECSFTAFGETFLFPATYEYRGSDGCLRVACASTVSEAERDVITRCAASPFYYGFRYTVHSLWWRSYFCKAAKVPMGPLYIPEGCIPLSSYTAKAFKVQTREGGSVRICTDFIVDLGTLVPTLPAALPLLCAATIDYPTASARFSIDASYNTYSASLPSIFLPMVCGDLVPLWVSSSNISQGSTTELRSMIGDERGLDFSGAPTAFTHAVMAGVSDSIGTGGSTSFREDIAGQNWLTVYTQDHVDTASIEAIDLYGYFPGVLSRYCVFGENTYATTLARIYSGPSTYTESSSMSLSSRYSTQPVTNSEILGPHTLGYWHSLEDTAYASLSTSPVFPVCLSYASTPLLVCAPKMLTASTNTNIISSGHYLNGDTFAGVFDSLTTHERDHTQPATHAHYLHTPFNKAASIVEGSVVSSPPKLYSGGATGEYASLEGDVEIESSNVFFSADVALTYYETGYDYVKEIGSVSATAGNLGTLLVLADIFNFDGYAGDRDEYIWGTPPTVSGAEWAVGLSGEQLGYVRTFANGKGLVLPRYGVVMNNEPILRKRVQFSLDSSPPEGYATTAGFSIVSVVVAETTASKVTYIAKMVMPTTYVEETSPVIAGTIQGPDGRHSLGAYLDSAKGMRNPDGTTTRTVGFEVWDTTGSPLSGSYFYVCIAEDTHHVCSQWVRVDPVYAPALRGAVAHQVSVAAEATHHVTRYPFVHNVSHDVSVTRSTHYAPARHVYPNVGMMQGPLEGVYEELGEATYAVVQGASAVVGGEGHAVFAVPVLATKSLFSQKSLIGLTEYAGVVAALSAAVSSAETQEEASPLQAVRSRLEATATPSEKTGAAMPTDRVYDAFVFAFSEIVEVLCNDFASMELMFLMADKRQSFALLPVSARLPSGDTSLVKVLN
jgi:hypothetical protein